MHFCIFDFQGHYDDVKMYLMAKWDLKSYLRLILYLNMKKKLAILIHPNGLFIGMFLPVYAMYYKNRACGRLSWTDAHSVINSDKEINLVSNCSENYEEYPVKSFCWAIIFRSAVTNENVQKCVFCVIFYEMLKMVWNVCKKNLRRF